LTRPSHDSGACALAGTGGVSRALETGRACARRTTASAGQRQGEPAKARAALLPVGPDARVPMREVYQMFRGTLTPEQVLSAAGSQPVGQFYGQLYAGLYFEALGEKGRALEHIKIAAADRFERHGGYMHMVARVHLRSLTSR
jgi:hypothetical protein